MKQHSVLLAMFLTGFFAGALLLLLLDTRPKPLPLSRTVDGITVFSLVQDGDDRSKRVVVQEDQASILSEDIDLIAVHGGRIYVRVGVMKYEVIIGEDHNIYKIVEKLPKEASILMKKHPIKALK